MFPFRFLLFTLPSKKEREEQQDSDDNAPRFASQTTEKKTRRGDGEGSKTMKREEGMVEV